MDVLLLEVPQAPFWNDEGPDPVLMVEDGGFLALSDGSPGAILIDADGDTLLVPELQATFLLSQGEQGPPGASGSEIHYVDAAPDSPLGVDGDVAIERATGKQWKKSGATWIDQGTPILGVGATLPDLVAGEVGLFFHTGETADPDDLVPYVSDGA